MYEQALAALAESDAGKGGRLDKGQIREAKIYVKIAEAHEENVSAIRWIVHAQSRGRGCHPGCALHASHLRRGRGRQPEARARILASIARPLRTAVCGASVAAQGNQAEALVCYRKALPLLRKLSGEGSTGLNRVVSSIGRLEKA